jgi:adenylate cyclase
LRLSQAKVRSTVQRLGKTTKRCASVRSAISKFQHPVSAAPLAIFGVVDPMIVAYRGRIVGTAGDSYMLEFASVVDAVSCSVAVQRAMAVRNAEEPEGQRMAFRIGINLGDVIVSGSDILGDGVNIAARLEDLALPGGICVSGKVYDEVAHKLEL